MSRIISKRSLKLLVSLKSLLASPPTPPALMKINPYILKWCLTTFHTFSVQKEWLAVWSVKWVILLWQALVRTCGVGRDSDLVFQPRADIFLHKIRMCGRLGKISKFSPTSATSWLLCYGGKAASETWSGVSGRTQQKKVLLLSVQATARAVFLDYVHSSAW